MGGAGSMMHMITSLKNNKRRHKNHVPFRKNNAENRFKEKPAYDFPEATPEILMKIKAETIKTQRTILMRTIVIFIVLVVLLILAFI
ncbi:hypothetical protein ACU8DI_01020 [Psychroserpens sp. BH13MA-6]